MNNKITTFVKTLPLLAVLAVPVSLHSGISTALTTQSPSTVGVTVNGQLSAKAVSSDADLNTYTTAAVTSDMSTNSSATVNDDAQIKDVTYQDNGVTVDYTQPAKFLGLFPTNITAHVVVQADGSVTVNYPWYGFLIRKHADATTNIFQKQVTEATAGKADLSASASASLAPQTKAVILDALRQAIHGMRTKTSVQSTTSASVNQ